MNKKSSFILVEYFILKPLMKRGGKYQKLGIIQALLQILNEKLQNKRIGTKIYGN